MGDNTILMDVIDLKLSGLKLIKPRIFRDERGFFYESFRQPLFERLGLPPFVQDNVAWSKKDVLRALHYQETPGQAKLVSCPQGKIFDVAVDLRPGSKTFGQWEGVVLDDVDHAMLFIPVGFAHGYCALSDQTTVHYKVSALYDPSTERSIRWNDPDIGIKWPTFKPILSLRDQQSPFLKEVFGEGLDNRR